MRFWLIWVFGFGLLLANIVPSAGNNLRIGSVQVLGNNKIAFTISWDHSWNLDKTYPPFNHDAAWVFIKYRAAGGLWQHLDLSANAADHQSDSLTIETVSDGKGVFLRKKSLGEGNVDSARVVLQWAGYLYASTFDFKVFGIEMAWVPDGGFYVGDGASYNALRRGDKNAPYFIGSDDSIPIGPDSLAMIDTGASAPGGIVPALFPKGYAGFYCMKYEITQDQYVDFLNSLTYLQQKNHVTTSPDASSGSFAFGSVAGNRNGIVIETSGVNPSEPAVFACNGNGNTVFNDPADAQTRACNFLNWNDMAAYLQWAALRPMTELEFEKICRGPNKPIAREYAWGTPYALDANTMLYDGTDSEHVKEMPGADTGLASFGYAGPQGPIRAGFAANATSGRLLAGAAYYGPMEMSGNVWEMCIVLSKPGLAFTASLGNGNLPDSGFANMATWPLTDGKGAGYRGGGWDSGIAGQFRDLAVSDRFYVTLLPTLRRNTSGGRGVR